VHFRCAGTAQRELVYHDMLSETDAVISSHSSSSCLIGGDFNVELDRSDDISTVVNNFNHNNQLLRCDVLFPVTDRLIFYNESLQCDGMIDYFLTLHPNDTIAFNIVHQDINVSDHHLTMTVCDYFDNMSKSVPVTGHQGHQRPTRYIIST